MDAESVKWTLSQGIGAVLALAMFLVYRKDVHNALNSWQQQTKILTDLVRDVSVSLQAHTDAVRGMEAALPRMCPMADSATSAGPAASRRATDRMDHWTAEGRSAGDPRDNR